MQRGRGGMGSHKHGITYGLDDTKEVTPTDVADEIDYYLDNGHLPTDE